MPAEKWLQHTSRMAVTNYFNTPAQGMGMHTASRPLLTGSNCLGQIALVIIALLIHNPPKAAAVSLKIPAVFTKCATVTIYSAWGR